MKAAASPMSQAALDLGLGGPPITTSELKEAMLLAQVRSLLQSAGIEGLARELQRLRDVHAREVGSPKEATKRVIDAAQTAWSKRIVEALLTRMPVGKEKKSARGTPVRADALADRRLVTLWAIWKKQNPGRQYGVRKFVEWHRYEFLGLARPSKNAALRNDAASEIDQAQTRFNRARDRHLAKHPEDGRHFR